MPLSRIDPEHYEQLLADKAARFRECFAPCGLPEPEVFASQPLGYRLRAEFRIWHDGDALHYVMFNAADPRRPVVVEDFPPAAEPIRRLMPELRERLRHHGELRRKLFQVDFLATLSGEALVSLAYHRKLDAEWECAARTLAAGLKTPEGPEVRLIGRSRGQKIVLGHDWVDETFAVDGRALFWRQIEGGFTQPNGELNRTMLGWARAHAPGAGGDLLELYCGNGNFTVALAPLFARVLATEMNKSLVAAAQHNLARNGLGNVTLARLASNEVSAALARVRPFRRLAHVDLDAYRFSTLFVDPPRAGLDEATLVLARDFSRIVYISCNPATLRDNIAVLAATHSIAAAAIFDQFPYTDHLECGLVLTRR
jgi:tRNA (uracil-5-)-methyltransferase